jgi:HlyD family secretion protein
LDVPRFHREVCVKKIIILVAIVAALGGGGYAYWAYAAATKAKPVEIVKAKVERGPIRQVVASTGRVVSNLDVDIKCKASGEVIKLPFDVSDTVKNGELLIALDKTDERRTLDQAKVRVTSSQASLEIAGRNLAVAEKTLETDRSRASVTLKAAEAKAADARIKANRLKELLSNGTAAQEEYDTAETAAVQAAADLAGCQVKLEELKTQELALELRKQEVKLAEAQVSSDKIMLSIAQDRYDETEVRSPMDGVVSVRNVQIGTIISSGITTVGGGTTVLTLSDLSRIFVLASVDESDIGKVLLGQEATITADAHVNKMFHGKVVRIATKGVNLSNVVTFEVKIEVTDADKGLLKPEMTTNVEIVAAEKAGVLLAPAESVVRKAGGTTFVTLVKDDGSKEDVPVTIGISDSTKTEIVSGLTEGQMVLDRQAAADSKWAANQQGPQKGRGGPPPP